MMQLPLGLTDLLSHPAIQQALTQPNSMAAGQAPMESQGEDMVAEARPIHKGIFGIHGTARNILGVLGDAFLTQAGRNPIYAPARDREKMSDALGGSEDFVTNPLAAIQRFIKAGYPEQAQQLYSSHVQDTQRQTAQSIAMQEAQYKAQQRAAALLGSIKPDGSNYARVKELHDNYLKVHGIQPTVPLPDTYDPAAIAEARYSAYPVSQQIDDESTRDYRAKMVPIQQQKANASSLNAETNAKNGGVSRWTKVAGAYTGVANAANNTTRTEVYKENPPNQGRGKRNFGGGSGQRILGGHDASSVPPGTPLTSSSGRTMISNGKIWVEKKQ